MEVEAIVKAIVVCSIASLVIVLFVCHVRLSVMGEQIDTFLNKLTRRDQTFFERHYLEIKNRLDDIQDSIQTPREYILTRKEEKQ